MSRETLEWLNDNTLIGFTEEFGDAWHYDRVSDNHFAGAVPIDRVHNLFEWDAEFAPIAVGGVADEDTGFSEWVESPRYHAVVHGGTGEVFNIVTKRYAIHQYDEWLVDQVGTLVEASGGELAVGSAGLLRGGGQAWVQVRPPEYIEVGGERQLPWILATTSHDGSLATQYKAQRQRAVCDNTLAIALNEGSAEYRVRHVTGSGLLIAEAREALEVMFSMQDEFSAEVEQLMNSELSTAKFREVNNLLVPEVEPKVEDGKVTNNRAIRSRDNTIMELEDLWFNDPRVGDYTGTVWGAMQAHNTWFHWNRTHGTSGDKDLLKARQVASNVKGETAAYDRKVAGAIELVLA